MGILKIHFNTAVRIECTNAEDNMLDTWQIVCTYRLFQLSLSLAMVGNSDLFGNMQKN